MGGMFKLKIAFFFGRYCLWIVGNGTTLDYSDSVWANLVNDVKSRGCFFEAEEDEDLAQAIAFSLLELDQLDSLLHANSLLFRRARWKV